MPLAEALAVNLGLLLLFGVQHSMMARVSFKQWWTRWHGTTSTPPRFQTPLFYRVVRYPMQAGQALGLWATPRMTLGHLVLAPGLTAYILIGLYFEEHLVQSFGARYVAYRRRVPKLVPRLKLKRLSKQPGFGIQGVT